MYLNNKNMENKSISNAEAALLGLISEGPMHPYQIEQEVKYRDMRFWTELSMSSIYKLLRRLEKEGLVSREDKVSPENRLRKLYSISKEGKKALKMKIEHILSVPEHTRWQVDIGMYNLNLISDNKVWDSLSKYKIALQEKVKCYHDLLKFLQEANCSNHRFEIAKRPVYLLEAEIKWVDSYLNLLKP